MSNQETKDLQQPNAVDIILDGWLDSFKTLHTLQTEMVKKSLQPFTNQKDILTSSRKQLSKIEEDTNKTKEEWKSNLQNTIETINNKQVEELFSTWMSQVEDINHTIQTINTLSTQAILDFHTQAQAQLEANVKAALEKQQKESADVLKKIELQTERIKETHHALLTSR